MIEGKEIGRREKIEGGEVRKEEGDIIGERGSMENDRNGVVERKKGGGAGRTR